MSAEVTERLIYPASASTAIRVVKQEVPQLGKLVGVCIDCGVAEAIEPLEGLRK